MPRRMGANDNYTNSALRVGDVDPYPQRRWASSSAPSCPTTAVNDEYKHVVLKVHEHALKAYAGPDVSPALPVARRRRGLDAPADERLSRRQGRAARSNSSTRPRAAAPAAWRLLDAGRRLQRRRPARRTASSSTRAGRISWCSAAASAWRRWRRCRNWRPRTGVGVTAILSARHPGVVMSKELFDGLGARTITVLDSDNSSAVENVEKILEEPDRARARPTPSSPAAPTAC